MGAEFSIARLNVSYDFMPSYNVVGGDKDFNLTTGVSIRYIIDKKRLMENREKNQEKRKKQKAKSKKKKQKAKEKKKKAKSTNEDKKWWQILS